VRVLNKGGAGNQSARLIMLTSLTMGAFAANSILNRLAVDSGAADPGSFALIRVASGAVMLCLLVLLSRGQLRVHPRRQFIGGVSLTLYLIGFSLAYRSMDAGVGALVLFGVVQISMFVISALGGAPASLRQVIGSVVAFGGLVWVLWPDTGWSGNLSGAGLMALAGFGWAIYTLAGRAAPDALAGTAANFCVACVLTAVVVFAIGAPFQATPTGIALAVLSGAVTSGLGYAMWYAIVPRLDPAIAAIVQLSVPVLALAAGVLLLGEIVSARMILGSVLVLGGIAIALLRPGRA